MIFSMGAVRVRHAVAIAIVMTVGVLVCAQSAAAAPPPTTITSGPPENGPTNDTTPTFEFTAPGAASLSCSIDAGPGFQCSSPYTTPALSEAGHSFSVTAVNAGGEASAALRNFTVDVTPPVTTITQGPADGSTINTDDPVIGWSANEENSTFTCIADGVRLSSCEQLFVTGAPDGRHSFSIAATDPAGNTDPTPEARTFTVDLGAPPQFGERCERDGKVYTGTAGNDTRTGGAGTDIMFGLAGNDVLRGGSGADCLTGGPGNDGLSGGRGGDVLDGGSGSDRLSDSSGRDTFLGGAGNDRIQARDTARFGRRVADIVRCGGGRFDVAIVDRRDTVARDCERVRRR